MRIKYEFPPGVTTAGSMLAVGFDMVSAFPWHWFGRTVVPRPVLQVLLYTRTACPLCDEALTLLERYRRKHGFRLEIHNVDDAEELVREFGDWVPVVTIAGRVRFRGHVNEVLLQRILYAQLT